MTVSGLKVLQKEEASRGFFLLIEGGRIDHVSVTLLCLGLKRTKLVPRCYSVAIYCWYQFQANHVSAAARALAETLALERVVQVRRRKSNS